MSMAPLVALREESRRLAMVRGNLLPSTRLMVDCSLRRMMHGEAPGVLGFLV
jgi:hypothetical protein